MSFDSIEASEQESESRDRSEGLDEREACASGSHSEPMEHDCKEIES